MLLEVLDKTLEYNARLDISRNVASALGKIGDPKAVPKLIELFDEMLYARQQVADALGLIRDPRAVEMLSSTLDAEPQANDKYWRGIQK